MLANLTSCWALKGECFVLVYTTVHVQSSCYCSAVVCKVSANFTVMSLFDITLYLQEGQLLKAKGYEVGLGKCLRSFQMAKTINSRSRPETSVKSHLKMILKEGYNARWPLAGHPQRGNRTAPLLTDGHRATWINVLIPWTGCWRVLSHRLPGRDSRASYRLPFVQSALQEGGRDDQRMLLREGFSFGPRCSPAIACLSFQIQTLPRSSDRPAGGCLLIWRESWPLGDLAGY